MSQDIENVMDPKVIQVIRTRIWRGALSNEGPHFKNTRRLVIQFHSLDGKYLGEGDPAVCEICRQTGSIALFCTSDHK